MLTSARAEEALSSSARLPLLDAEVQALRAHATSAAQEHAQALAQAHAFSQEVVTELTRVRKDNEQLVERCSSILLDACSLETARSTLVDEVADKSEKYEFTIFLRIYSNRDP